MHKIACLIPCYNEGKTIAKVVHDFKTVLPEAVVYVYNNNSLDDTEAQALAAGAVVRNAFQQGKGNVVRQMFREVDAECYIMVDGDDTYPATNAREMADEVLLRGAHMVVGDRLSSTYFQENKRPFHNFGNALVRRSINSLFHSDIKDIMTGYRAFSYEFVKSYSVLSNGFEIETEMSIHAVDKRLDVRNVVIDYRDRPAGSESKLNTYVDGAKVLLTVLRLYRTYRPFRFFGCIALVLSLVAVVLLVPVACTYWETGLVPRYPTLIVCGFMIMGAVHSFFAGLALQNMVLKNYQDFEERFIGAANRKRELLER